MNKLTTILVVLLSTLASLVGTAQDAKSQTVTESVDVYYFHFTRRCMTCNAVESESKKAIEVLYPAQVKAGQVTFKGVNLDDETSKADADKCGASGQSLLIVSGDKKTDLTTVAFMNAKSNPDKLKAEIKKVVDEYLAQ